MKKVYQKPQVYLETFRLSEHIAGCNLTLLDNDVYTCKASGTISWFPGEGGSVSLETWFSTSGTGGCTFSPEGYCYTNGNSTLATINS